MTREDLSKTKELIADVVLEFYGDLEFLPKTRIGLLEHYERIGYLSDLDKFQTVYAPSDGCFLVLKNSDGIFGCGGIRRLENNHGELVRLWLRKEIRKRGYGRMIFESLLKKCEEVGFDEVYLDTSNRCTEAIKLFRQNGFNDCHKYKESIGDVFMCKKMKP